MRAPHLVGKHVNRIDATHRKVWGMPTKELEALAPGIPVNSPAHPKQRYIQHRSNAKDRGIAWEFTFATWWAKWVESGKWDQRGQGAGQFCMTRRGDVGAYNPDNVRIATQADNIREGYESTPYHERWPDGHPLPNSIRGKIKPGTKGYRFDGGPNGNSTYPWAALSVTQVRIGRFATEAEAQACRRGYLAGLADATKATA